MTSIKETGQWRRCVLDTNALIYNPQCITDDTFGHSHIYIPEIVITELEKFKKEQTARGFAARETARIMRDLRQRGNLNVGITLENGRRIQRVKAYQSGNTKPLTDGWSLDDPDQIILRTAVDMQHVSEEQGENAEPVYLVTSDLFLADKADTCGVAVCEFVDDGQNDRYTGQREVLCEGKDYNRLYRKKDWYLEPEALLDTEGGVITDLHVNEFVTIRNRHNQQLFQLGRCNDHGLIVPLRHENDDLRGVKPRTIAQKFLLEALLVNPKEQRLIIVEGPAGTGKTFLALAAGMYQKRRGQFERFYVTRANVEADSSFGFLPGTLEAKFDGFLNPIYDNLDALERYNKELKQKAAAEKRAKEEQERAAKEAERATAPAAKTQPGKPKNLAAAILEARAAKEAKKRREKSPPPPPAVTDEEKLKRLADNGIDARPLNYMRGRSLYRSYILVDEAQNLTREQVKMIVTRAGEGSVVVLTGDVTQIDTPRLNRFNNGLTHAFNAMDEEPICWRLRLNDVDNQRCLLSQIASKKL
ncbi:MAG: PhoH family protein [bacterium]|nr:PhoH family protein [bacterium]